MTFGNCHIRRCLSVVVQCAEVGTRPNEEVANGQVAHARGKVEWCISPRVGRVEARRCRKFGKALVVPFGDQPALERPKNIAFRFARRLVATSKYAGQPIHDLHEWPPC